MFNFSERWFTQDNRNMQKTSAPCSSKSNRSNSQKNYVSTEILIKAQFFNSGWLKYTMNYKDIPFMVTKSWIRINKQQMTDLFHGCLES